jgi:hypothetical protein
VAHRELLVTAQGQNQRRRPVVGTDKARGIGDFPRRSGPTTERGGGRPVGRNGTRGPQGSGAERERERERELAERVHDAGRVWFNGSGPLELRNGFLILDKGFPLL